jgi:hypothetical protein
MTEIKIFNVCLFSLECNAGKSMISKFLNYFRGGDGLKMS